MRAASFRAAWCPWRWCQTAERRSAPKSWSVWSTPASRRVRWNAGAAITRAKAARGRRSGGVRRSAAWAAPACSRAVARLILCGLSARGVNRAPTTGESRRERHRPRPRSAKRSSERSVRGQRKAGGPAVEHRASIALAACVPSTRLACPCPIYPSPSSFHRGLWFMMLANRRIGRVQGNGRTRWPFPSGRACGTPAQRAVGYRPECRRSARATWRHSGDGG